MRRLLLISLLTLGAFIAAGQTVNKLEYFIDTDPGYGNGTQVAITPSSTITNFNLNVPVASLTPGIHTIYVRSRDSNKVWGQTYATMIYKQNLSIASPLNVIKAEFFVDIDPGYDLGTAIPITPGTNIQNLSVAIPVSAMTEGAHTLYVRFKDANKVWGQTHASIIYKQSVAAANVTKAEYFIDTDPGYGLATSIPFTPGANVQNIAVTVPVTSLTNGIHTLYVRFRDANKKWGQTNSSVIYKAGFSAASPANVTKGEYFIDTDPGFGLGTPISFTPGSNVQNINIAVPLNSLSDGPHTIYVRFRDANKVWGQSTPNILVKQKFPITPLANITRVEYFIGNDPGFGNGTIIPITAAPTISDVPFALNVSALAEGTYKLNVRARDRNGRWSMVLTTDLKVCNQVGTTLNAATSVTPTGFIVSWNSAVNATWYELDVSTDNFATFISGYQAKSVTGTSHALTGLSSVTEYKVRVRAVSTCPSMNSNVVTVSTTLALPSAQPTNITFTNATENSVTTSFTGISPTPTGYLVIRRAGASPTFVPQDNTVYNIGDAVGDGVVVRTGASGAQGDTGLQPDTRYFYDVFSYNRSGAVVVYRTTSPLEGNFSTFSPQPTSQPTNIVFSNVNDTGFTINFTAPTPSPAGYLVLRNTNTSPSAIPVDGTSYTTTVSGTTVAYNGSATSFTETALSTNSIYYYAIYAYNGSVPTAINYLQANPLTGNQGTSTTLPSGQPTALIFSSLTTTSYTVSFTKPSGSVGGYLVVRKEGSKSAFVPAPNIPYAVGQDLGDGTVVHNGNGVTFNESSLPSATTFHYTIFAYNQSGSSIGYRTASPLEGNITTLVAEPTSQASAIVFAEVTTTSVKVSFTAANPAAANYLVVRQAGTPSTFVPADGTSYAPGSTTGDVVTAFSGPATTFVDNGLSPGVTYYYRVFAYNGTGAASNYNNTVSTGNAASIITVPAAPVILDAGNVGQTGFTMNWTAVSGAASYRVDISKDDFTTKVVGYDNAVANTNLLQVTGLDPGVQYNCRVRAINSSGISEYSVAATRITVSATPVMNAATEVGQTSMKLTWSTVLTAAKYNLDVSSDNFLTYHTGFQDVAINTNTVVVTGFTPGIIYQYRVRSSNTGGTSPNSNVGSQLLLPGTPEKVDASNVTGSSFKANWKVVANVTEYRLDVSREDNNFNPSLPDYNNLLITGNNEKLVQDLTPNVNYVYRVRAVNATGASPNSVITTVRLGGSGGNILSVTASDPPATFSSESITVTANASGSNTAITVTLFYRKISGTSFTGINAPAVSGTSYAATLQKLFADELGVEFYFRAEDADGQRAESAKKIIYMSLPTQGIKIPFTKYGGVLESYEIFSIPHQLTDNQISAIFFDDLGAYKRSRWRLVRYQDGRNVDFDEGLLRIEPGKSYWFNRKDNTDVFYDNGRAVEVSESKPFSLRLAKEWNQIGNPYPFDIDWSDILALPANAAVASKVSQRLRVYNSEQLHLNDESDVLVTGSGAFVHNDSDQIIDLVIPPSLKNSASRTGPLPHAEHFGLESDRWFVDVSLKIGGLKSSAMTFGMQPTASQSKDVFDDVIVPRFLNYIEFYTEHPDFFSPRFSKDIVPTETNHNWDFTFETNVKSDVATLNWDRTRLGNGAAKLLLIDVTNSRWVDMKENDSYTFHVNDKGKFKVVFATDEAQMDFSMTMLGKPYPNPFRDGVVMPFMVNNDKSPIKITVMDMMGRVVSQPVNGTFDHGLHTVSWDGTGPAKDVLPAGMYFCRLESNGVSIIERIIKY